MFTITIGLYLHKVPELPLFQHYISHFTEHWHIVQTALLISWSLTKSLKCYKRLIQVNSLVITQKVVLTKLLLQFNKARYSF